MDLLQPSIVRILTRGDDVVGAGFMISDNKVVTCAHVIRDALGARLVPDERPSDVVHVDFPFLHPRRVLVARIVHWRPEYRGNPSDVAGLEIDGYPHSEAMPVGIEFHGDEATYDGRFRSYGFPNGFDEGVWAYGHIMDDRGDGSYQLEDVKVPGMAIEGGFSGGPVWNVEHSSVAGMIATASRNIENKVAFMIPIHTIVETWPGLEPTHLGYEEVGFPIVIAAMTRQEARELITSGDGADSNSDLSHFLSLFKESDIDMWLSNYGERRRDWMPHVFTPRPISEILSDIVDAVNKNVVANSGREILRPRYAEHLFFGASNREAQEELWDDMSEQGGIVVIDALSLFHPSIAAALRTAQADASNRVAIIEMFPTDQSFIEVTNLLEKVTGQNMRQFLRRFSYYDDFCQIGTTDINALDRWLLHVLPKVGSTKQEYISNPDNLRKFRMQRQRTPRGYSRLITKGVIAR